MKNFFGKYSPLKWTILITTLLLLPSGSYAAEAPKASELANPLAIVLLIVIIGLLLVIAFLASINIQAAKLNLQRFVEEKTKHTVTAATKIVTTIVLCMIGGSLWAADAPVAGALQHAAESSSIAGLSYTSFYTLLSVIFLELIILLALLNNLKLLLQKELVIIAGSTEKVVPKQGGFKLWWEKFNSLKPIKEEAQIDLGHDYDGIRELDNRLPPWWLYGFYLCIIFAGIYMYRYHVAHSAPLSAEELRIDLAKADAEKEAYLKNAASNVDENTVKLLTSPDDLDAAKKIFTTVCAACHKADGGGMVGPNLTDDYWLHGGSIKDIFKTIKYGWPEKGMQSWKDTYSPTQIAQLASYVKSLHGTKPAVAKEPQGTLYAEEATGVKDTTKAKVDTLNAK